MIDINQAFEAAKHFLERAYSNEENLDPSLEEVEISDDERYWNITLGFTRKAPPTTTLELLVGRGLAGPLRTYKVFSIHADSGQVKSMKIKQ